VHDHHIEPDLASAALVTIDTQRDVLDGQPFEIPGTSAALPAMGRVARAFRAAGRPIVHILRLYLADASNVDLCRRGLIEGGLRLLAPGSDGAELAPGLAPDDAPRLDTELLLTGGVQLLGPAEVAIYKPRWGAFFRTPLEEHLRGLDISTLAFCGCNFPNCPRTSIYEASERDFRLVLVEDAISGLYEQGRAELRGIGVRLIGASALVAALGVSEPADASPPTMQAGATPAGRTRG
jgi:nicotinamidase-related amidase